MTAGDAVGTPQQIVDRAVELGWSAAAITDHGWLGGAPAFYKAARKAGIKPIIGCEMYVTSDLLHGVRGKEADGWTFHLTVLALSREGYENLVAWTTEAMLRENYHRKPRISVFAMAEIAPHSLDHNVVLSGCLASELSRTVAEANGGRLALAVEYIRQMKNVFSNFYIEVADHTAPKFLDEAYPVYLDLLAKEEQLRNSLIKLARITDTPLVLTNDSHMQRPQDRKAHIALKAVGGSNRDDEHMGRTSETLISRYLPQYSYFGHYMRDMERVARYNEIPDDALESVAEIVENADIRLEPVDNFSYSIPTSGRDDPVQAIRRRAKNRLAELVERHGDGARERVEHELKSMEGFADYLLLMSDFIKEAKRMGILTWTRGSAANSLLCYCLGIHEIDSIEYGLLFSRFFNPARKKLPDIDLDIDPDRYDDFMQIVQTVMEPLIGKGQVVQISNWGTAANRRAFRMAASALGMPKEEQDEVSRLLPQMIDSGMVDEDTDVFIALREDYPELYEIASEIFDSITSVSQHACAWVFGTPDRPLERWIPLYLIASSGTLVTQYDFKTLEDFGLTKMDFLRLKSLSIVSKTMRMAGMSPLEFHDLPLDDADTFAMIGKGLVDGVHTLQGKETRKGLLEMQPQDVHDIIRAAALYRPANTREGKDKLYLKRRAGEEGVEFEHEILEEILGPTEGISLFQEQAMEICYACGCGDAFVDDVYQAIKKAKGAGRGAKEAFAALESEFNKRCRGHLGVSEGVAQQIWERVKSFQGYGFNKGHATSYGLLGYSVAYLKRHYPAEFFAALLDVFPERPTYLNAARAEGYKFLPPDVNRSSSGFGIDKLVQNGIRVGISKVFRVGPVGTGEILDAQPFTDFDDFKARTSGRGVKSTAIENLQRVGAFQSLGIKGDKAKDAAQFHVIGFTLEKPVAFDGCKPRHVGARTSSSGWKHLGREKGLEFTQGRCSVSKLFWLPPYAQIEERTKTGQKKQSYMQLKSSPWANVKTWLLTVVDENGLPFHLMVNEDKQHEAALLKFLYQRCQGAVVCLDGMIRLPFLQNGPQGFRMFGVTGAFDDDPQMWHLPSDKELKYKNAVAKLDQVKRRSR
jgi:DNA polymerase III subunit alpha